MVVSISTPETSPRLTVEAPSRRWLLTEAVFLFGLFFVLHTADSGHVMILRFQEKVNRERHTLSHLEVKHWKPVAREC